jgi:predicted dienelactone hydrolase
LPVLLYSPSLNSERRENLYKLLDLASHGFVVAATDHRETFASAFPNGAIVEGTRVPETSIQAIRASIQDRVADVQFVLGELTRMNDDEPRWAGRLDLARVGVFGFSIGGSTAAELCRTDPRIRAGAGMDGVFFLPDALESPLPKPFMMLRADQPEITMPDGRPDDRLPVIEKMTRDGYFIQLAGTVHWSFSDYPLLTTEDDFQKKVGTPRNPLLAPTRINQLSAAYLVSFFKKYLLDQDDHRLDQPPADVPEILRFVAK